MNDALLYDWHGFIAALVAFTLLGHAGLMMGHGREHLKSRPVRNTAARKEKTK